MVYFGWRRDTGATATGEPTGVGGVLDALGDFVKNFFIAVAGEGESSNSSST